MCTEGYHRERLYMILFWTSFPEKIAKKWTVASDNLHYWRMTPVDRLNMSKTLASNYKNLFSRSCRYTCLTKKLKLLDPQYWDHTSKAKNKEGEIWEKRENIHVTQGNIACMTSAPVLPIMMPTILFCSSYEKCSANKGHNSCSSPTFQSRFV